MERSRGKVEKVGAAVGRAADRVMGRTGSALGVVFGMGRRRGPSSAHSHRPPPGTAAGLEYAAGEGIRTPPKPGEVVLRVLDYSADKIEETEFERVEDLPTRPVPEWAKVRWIDVRGLHPFVIEHLREAYGFHTLAAEDVLHVPQRPRAEPYDGHTFITLRMLQMMDRDLSAEQVSMFLYPKVLVTFQERPEDVWEPVRTRLRTDGSRIRGKDSSFLAYALLDAIVDHGFPILEHYGERLEGIEEAVMEADDPEILRRIQAIRRELSILRKTLWPTREMLDVLMRSEKVGLPKLTRTFLSDVHAHAIQIIDVIETHREVCGTLSDLYMSVVSNRMNEVMKTLTIIATLFIPITFLAGVYGMNFEYLPELKYRWAYPAFWGICLVVTVILLGYFRRKRWL